MKFALITMLLGCSSLSLDPSTPAVEAGDYTLAVSACKNVPGGGMDICHVKEGAKIVSSWKLFVPKKNVLGGEVNVYYRDVSRSYPLKGHIIEIPWADFMGSDTWSRSMDGEALALVLVRYETPAGIEEIAHFRGIAKIVVTAKGYARMPIDSGFHTWGMTCEVQYSTAGRGAVICH